MAAISTSKTDNKTDFLKRPAVHLLIILAVGLLAYSNTFRGPIQWDGVPTILENPLMKDVGNFISSSRGYDANPRRFIGNLTFALNYSLGGPNVIGYHIVNLLIHLSNALLVYVLVSLTFRTFSLHPPHLHASPSTPHSSPFTIHDSRFTAFIPLFSALLFVSHPLQTQAVTYVYQRYTSLAALFYLVSLVAYIKGRLSTQNSEKDSPFTIHNSQFTVSVICYLLSIVSAVLAMKTKEIAFTLPLVIILYEFTFFKLSFKKKLLFLAPIALTLIIIPLSVLHSNKSLGELLADVGAKARLQTDMPRWDYFVTELRVMVTYLRLLFAPINQNVDYDYPIYHSLWTPPVLFSFIFLFSILGLGTYLLYSSRIGNLKASPFAPYERLVGFGILWFFITLSVESSVIPIVDVIFEHRVYLPSVGLFIALSTVLLITAERLKFQKAVIILLCLATAALSGLTYARNNVWRNMVHLFSDTVQKSPSKVRPHKNLGDAYSDAGFPAESLREFQTAVRLGPDDAESRYNLGTAYLKQNRGDEAIGEFQAALTISPAFAYAHSNLGTAYAEKHRWNEAIREFKAAIDITPDDAEAHSNLGSAYADSGRYEDAISELQTAVTLRPDDADAVNIIGNVYLKMGRLDEAAKEFQAGLRLRPDAADMHFNLGIVRFLQGRNDEAIGEFEIAVNLKPDDADAHNNLGMAYFKQGRNDEAIREFKIAVNLRPDDADARRNLENTSRAAKSNRKGK